MDVNVNEQHTVATIDVKCNMCKETTQITVPFAKLQRWLKFGDYIQDVFPELTPDNRELLISGTCPTCFKKLFGDE